MMEEEEEEVEAEVMLKDKGEEREVNLASNYNTSMC